MNSQQHLGRIDGFDYLRCLGLVLVLSQHQLSILGFERYASILGVNLGQLGVSVFLAVSGVLARQTNREPEAWLLARLQTIYPAYWIATLFGYIAAAASGYKKITVYQLLSQLAGTGLFTHGMDLVNVATWFVSLLLALYLIVYAAKRFRFNDSVLFLLALILLIASALGSGTMSMILAHAATFFLAYICVGSKRDRFWYFSCLIFLAFLSVKSEFAIYPAASISLCYLALGLPSAPKLIKLMSNYSYEFYLLHGIFLVGSQQLFKTAPWVRVPLGILSAMFAAFFLHHSILKLRRYWPKRRPVGDKPS